MITVIDEALLLLAPLWKLNRSGNATEQVLERALPLAPKESETDR